MSAQHLPVKGVDVHGASFGGELFAMGALGLASVFLPLEFAVYVGGPAFAGVAILYTASKAWMRAGTTAVAVGAWVTSLGVLLATHDYIWTGELAILIHFGIAVSILLTSAFQSLIVLPPATRSKCEVPGSDKHTHRVGRVYGNRGHVALAGVVGDADVASARGFRRRRHEDVAGANEPRVRLALARPGLAVATVSAEAASRADHQKEDYHPARPHSRQSRQERHKALARLAFAPVAVRARHCAPPPCGCVVAVLANGRTTALCSGCGIGWLPCGYNVGLQRLDQSCWGHRSSRRVLG